MAVGKPRIAGRIWGDGFADDGWSEAVSVRRWEQCSPDEYIRLFPNLVALASQLPDCLRRHLTDCVAARAWALRGCQALGGEPVTSVGATAIENRGPRAAADWFATEGWASWFRADRPARPDAEPSRGLAALRFVDHLVSGILAGRPAPFDPAASLLFAFHAGLHPLYVWPEASAMHERDVAAGWLGHLSRRRRAFMPIEVAEYLADAVGTSADGAGFLRDPDLAPLTADLADLASIGRAARARLRGVRTAVHAATVKRETAPSRVMRRTAARDEALIQ